MRDHRSETLKLDGNSLDGTKKFMTWLLLCTIAVLVATTVTACSRLTPTVVINAGIRAIRIESMENEKLAEVEPGEMVLFQNYYPSREGDSYYFVIKETQEAGVIKEDKRYISADEFRDNFVDHVLILKIDTSESNSESLIKTSEW
jgi:hypothetical protein